MRCGGSGVGVRKQLKGVGRVRNTAVRKHPPIPSRELSCPALDIKTDRLTELGRGQCTELAQREDGGWDIVGAVHSLDHLPADLRT